MSGNKSNFYRAVSQQFDWLLVQWLSNAIVTDDDEDCNLQYPQRCTPTLFIHLVQITCLPPCWNCVSGGGETHFQRFNYQADNL